MLPVTGETMRLFLHVGAACVWVGGQFALAGMVPGLRQVDEGAPRAAARGFNRVAWPAFGVLVITGVWSLLAIDIGATTTAYQVTAAMKLAVVALSGVAAMLHTLATSRVGLAVWGALSALGAIGALFLGVMLSGSSIA